MKPKKQSKTPTLSIGAAVAVFVLIIGGGGHRWLDRLLIAADAVPVQLDRPLSTLPLELGDWTGTDMPIDQRVLAVAGCDDYVSRRYVDASTGRELDLYIAYAARPAKMLSHRPQVCYPAHGWTPVDTRTVSVASGSGSFDGLLHRFKRHQPVDESITVLNYYVLRGKHVTEWTDFWGPTWRLPNLSRDPSFYVAQVQVSARLGLLRETEAEQLIMGFVGLVAAEVDGMLPGMNADKPKSDGGL